MLVVELHRGHGAVLVVVLLLIPELPAESLRRAAQASAHYSEYLPREANSCEPAGTCSCASPTTAMPLQCGFPCVRTSWRSGIVVVTINKHTHINYLQSAPEILVFQQLKTNLRSSVDFPEAFISTLTLHVLRSTTRQNRSLQIPVYPRNAAAQRKNRALPSLITTFHM